MIQYLLTCKSPQDAYIYWVQPYIRDPGDFELLESLRKSEECRFCIDSGLRVVRCAGRLRRVGHGSSLVLQPVKYVTNNEHRLKGHTPSSRVTRIRRGCAIL